MYLPHHEPKSISMIIIIKGEKIIKYMRSTAYLGSDAMLLLDCSVVSDA